MVGGRLFHMQSVWTNKRKNQLLFLVLAVGFFIGIIYQNLTYAKGTVALELFEKGRLQQYLQIDVITEKYLWYVLKERILLFGLVCLCGSMRWKKMFVTVLLFILGFLLGMLGVIATLQLGGKGILFCLGVLLPHGIFYSLAIGMLLTYWFHAPRKEWNRVKTIFVILMFLLGILVETYVNPFLLKFMIRMI